MFPLLRRASLLAGGAVLLESLLAAGVCLLTVSTVRIPHAGFEYDTKLGKSGAAARVGCRWHQPSSPCACLLDFCLKIMIMGLSSVCMRSCPPVFPGRGRAAASVCASPSAQHSTQLLQVAVGEASSACMQIVSRELVLCLSCLVTTNPALEPYALQPQALLQLVTRVLANPEAEVPREADGVPHYGL